MVRTLTWSVGDTALIPSLSLSEELRPGSSTFYEVPAHQGTGYSGVCVDGSLSISSVAVCKLVQQCLLWLGRALQLNPVNLVELSVNS